MQRQKLPCTECGKPTIRQHPILGISLCQPCQNKKKDKYKYISKTRAMGDYRLNQRDLSELKFHAVDNPHYKTAPQMQLYHLPQVEELARKKWGAPEPYTVKLVNISINAIHWLARDLERFKLITPEDFQNIVAERLQKFGLEVQLVGKIYQKDGGIDIVAYPKDGSLPFLMGVQVKHHTKNYTTGPEDVRNFHGALVSGNSPFHMGMIVTNTSFTPDAEWFAEQNSRILRLRDINALRRWLQNDFVNENEWKEIPKKIVLAPGIEVEIHKPNQNSLNKSAFFTNLVKP